MKPDQPPDQQQASRLACIMRLLRLVARGVVDDLRPPIPISRRDERI